MNDRKFYEKAEVTVFEMQCLDVIRTSNVDPDPAAGENEIGAPWKW